jgi:chromosome segregation ATPase
MHQSASLSKNPGARVSQMEPPPAPSLHKGNVRNYYSDDLKNSLSSQGDFQKLISNATELENVKIKLEMDYNNLEEELQSKEALVHKLKENLDVYLEQEKAFEVELGKVNENIKSYEKELYKKIQTTQKLEFSVEAAKKRLEALKAEVKQEQAEYDEQLKNYAKSLKDLLPEHAPSSGGSKNKSDDTTV